MTTKRQNTKVDEEIINNDALIREIKVRPALYDKNHTEYNEQTLKCQLWEEVATEVFYAEWRGYNEAERAEAVRIVQKRWKNLRTCLSRELRERRQGAKKRRKYIYYNKLQFLLPLMGINTHELDLQSARAEVYEVGEEAEMSDATVEHATQPGSSKLRKQRKTLTNKHGDEDEAQLTEKVNDVATLHGRNEPTDAVTLFLLSLAPRLRPLPHERMLEAQIQILQVFKNLTPATTEPREEVYIVESTSTLKHELSGSEDTKF